MNKKTKTVHLLLTPEEKKTIRAARKILKRLTKQWNKLEDVAYATGQEYLDLEGEFLDKTYSSHIAFNDDGAYIDLEA